MFRGKRLTIVLNEDEFAVLKEMGKQHQNGMSEVVRNALNFANPQLGRHLKAIPYRGIKGQKLPKPPREPRPPKQLSDYVNPNQYLHNHYIPTTNLSYPVLRGLISSYLNKRIKGSKRDFLIDRQTEIIWNRYCALNRLTLEDLAPKYNLTRERIRQIESRTIRTLRFAAHKDAGFLKDVDGALAIRLWA